MKTKERKTAGAPLSGEALLILERMDEGYYAIDRDWRFQYVNRSAELFWRRQRAELIGESMLTLFARFAGSPAHAAHVRVFESGEPVRLETISTATETPVELRLFPSPYGLSVYFHDITRRRQMEQDLKTRDELLTLAELSAGIGVWVADLTTGMLMATPQFFRLHGLEPVDGPVSQDLPRSVRHIDDRERVTNGFREAMSSGADAYEVEYRIIRPSGEQRWIFGRGRVIRDDNGRPWRYSGVDLDITERKQQEEHLRMVMGELLHRTNNLLAVVQGLAQQTARSSKDLADFTPAFNARLRGLGGSTSLLTREEWRGALLNELVEAQVAPFARADRFELGGPRVMLSPKAVQNIGLALHELCTNAIKYGALSQPGGRVRVGWEIAEADGKPELQLLWKELDGPRVAPPQRAGFGRVVSEQMIASALGARVTTSFEPDGVEWHLALPQAEFSRDHPPPP